MRPALTLALHLIVPALILALTVCIALSYYEWTCSDLKSDPVMQYLPSPARCIK